MPALLPAASRRPPTSMRISAPAAGISGDAAALEAAVTIRKLFDGKALVPGVKALLAHIHGDAALGAGAAPLAPFPAADRAAVVAGYDGIRAKRVA